MEYVDLSVLATEDNFEEQGYLEENPDVAAAVVQGQCESGFAHFLAFGQNERRHLSRAAHIVSLRQRKMLRLKPFLRRGLPHRYLEDKLDYLTDELRRETSIVDTRNVSSNRYDRYAIALIEACDDGLVLDCGAGSRDRYYDNVVNYEIVNYNSTDVIGVGEVLPFKDATFDGVLSLSVLEHVRDPFRCANEIARVLKPGGKLICAVPFLQPLHGYPHHYYNMTHQGLRALFERKLQIDDHLVIDSIHPIWSLTWMVKSWAEGLPVNERQQFLDMRVGDLVHSARELLSRPCVKSLSNEKKFELASATMLFATKAQRHKGWRERKAQSWSKMKSVMSRARRAVRHLASARGNNPV